MQVVPCTPETEMLALLTTSENSDTLTVKSVGVEGRTWRNGSAFWESLTLFLPASVKPVNAFSRGCQWSGKSQGILCWVREI